MTTHAGWPCIIGSKRPSKPVLSSHRPLSLHHLTALDASPLELVDIEAAVHCTGVCLFVHCPAPGARFPVLAPGDKAEMTRRLAGSGVELANIEFFWVVPEMPWDAYREAMDLGASLGAKRIVVHIHDDERDRATETFARLCAHAGERGLGAGLEFMRFTPACDGLEKARDFVIASGASNAGIAIDALHLQRTGGTPADVARLDPRLVSYVQLCDGPRTRPDEELRAEAIEDRMVPGEGEFPLDALMAALPQHVPLDVEVPQTKRQRDGVSALGRATLAVEGARRLLVRASSA